MDSPEWSGQDSTPQADAITHSCTYGRGGCKRCPAAACTVIVVVSVLNLLIKDFLDIYTIISSRDPSMEEVASLHDKVAYKLLIIIIVSRYYHYNGVVHTVQSLGDADRQQAGQEEIQPMSWPQVGTVPINEFRTEGYMSRIRACPHVCNKAFSQVKDFKQDLIQLISTCQRHTRCSPAYCLRTKNGKQQCRFGYPKPLMEKTTLGVVDGHVELDTARNDPLVNSYNPMQLCSWRANVDMQYCVSRQKVIEYVVKYASKCEPRSEPLKKVYKGIVQALSDNDQSLKAVQKLLISSVGERDFSAQETCHLLLQLPLIMCSRDFIVLSLDGSRVVEDRLEHDQPATALSILDHYKARPATRGFAAMTLMHFAQHFAMPPQGERW